VPARAMMTENPLCRMCGAELRCTFVDLGKSPLCESFLVAEQLDQVERFYPLHVRICGECLLVQLEAYVPANEIFTEYAYFSAYSDSWVRHAEAYTEMIVDRVGLTADSLVLEIASNDGYLLQHFVQRGIPTLGVDPAVNVAPAALARGVPTIVDFFDSALAQQFRREGRQPNLIVANNVLAQVPELNDFVAGMEIALAEHGVVTVEVPHVVRLVDGLQFDTIYHEHYSYFSLTTLVRLFASHGLDVFDVEELASHGGSLRVYAKRLGDDAHVATGSVEALLATESNGGYDRIDGYQDFARRVIETKWALLELLIDLRRAGNSIVGYGAPGKGNTLLNYCAIRADLLDYTVDRNPNKQGRYLPGTHIPIYAPSKIEETHPAYVLVLPWNLKQEIMGQLSHIQEWGGQLIVPIPNPEIVSW
jgi:hypothetical protein